MTNTPNSKPCSESRVFQTNRVMPPDTNNHQTLFGGKLMASIDVVASISAAKHCRSECVTASMDSVDFLHPIRPTDAVHLESFVTYTGSSSMEIFVKVIAEHLINGESIVAATSFLTFVSLDEKGKPKRVPQVYPETEEEKYLFNSAEDRMKQRKARRKLSVYLAEQIEKY
ncbi:acyl-CoA thioesterase [Bacillus canaveralius]|uniref:Acyl-CoA thioesterase n=1 Tax=Bacillus canaveralius TaxID=1403243 RepID=A0A2N5GQC3_9BACI|nr:MULTISPECIES: acyl-CoA thioesterase [Bacillus]PLR85081.1 acyl-CoA thioesterase [Bacillus canaveralius]PLR85436.1 acyl-CoA thioesterase [Bacillus sp. V33-4]PLS00921.1 acyl-CoA thioesterase [Bacillus canaveralius]RSK54213.1 acyl-CoA thioesterase [Bacillus canaveralius]